MGKSSINGPFSMAMLNNQRVIGPNAVSFNFKDGWLRNALFLCHFGKNKNWLSSEHGDA